MYTGKERRQTFELNPIDKSRSAKMIDKRRTIIGKAETCDIILDFSDITPVHAILELTKEGNKIYDLNSKTGTYVNNVKVLIGEFKEGDKLKFGSHEFVFKKFAKEEAPPPFLQMLDPTLPEKFKPPEVAPPIPVIPKIEGVKIPPKPAFIPKVAYPLNEDPKAATSPFILEESDTLYPIFDYEPGKSSVEVMVHFQEKLISLDYIPLKNGKYPLVGKAKRMSDLELPMLGKKEKIKFLDISGGSVRVTTPIGFEPLFLMDKKSEGPINLTEDDLVRYYKNNVQILVRLGPKPPFVKRAPLLSKDKGLLKILVLVYLLMLAFLVFIAMTSVDVEKEKEKDKEKAPERIARILHKPKPIPVEEKKPEGVPESPKPEPEKAPEIKKVEAKVEPKPAPPKPPKKAEPPKAPVEMKKPIVTKKVSPKKAPPAPPKVKGPKAPPGKIVAKKQEGPVNTFNLGFKPNISSTLAKGESVQTASSATGISESEVGISGGVGAGGATTIKKAGIATGVGSLTGVAKGKLDTSEGVSELSDKKSMYSISMPGQGVIEGSSDPDLIRKILRENIPYFSNCYQKELEETGDISGLVKLNFVIGSSGSVSKASTTTSESRIPQSVIVCLNTVLKGIQFPRPMGGGTIEVSQPLNLQPKRI